MLCWSSSIKNLALPFSIALCAILIGLATVPSNTLQHIYTASGDICQSFWNWLLSKLGDDEFVLFVYGTTIFTMILYWGVGSVYVFMDMFNHPKWLRKYKVQPGTNEPVDTDRLLSAISQVLFNQICVGLPFAMIGYSMKPKTGLAMHELPSFHRVVADLIIFLLVEEIAFYYSHRLLHHKSLYKYIHKKHHEWTSPIAITAIYCHPLEHLIGNILPVALGPTMMRSHLAVSWLWYGRCTLRTLNNHSGYHFPGFISPEFHDFHHLKFTECYGLLGILDYLHGSDKLFRSSPSFKRHTMSFKLKSIRMQFPDDNSNRNDPCPSS